VTARYRLNPAVVDAVARQPGVTLAGSIYAASQPDRLAVAVTVAEANLWIHADVIVADGAHRGVDLDLVRELAARQLGPLDVHLITDRLSGLLDEVCRERVSRITFPLEACDGVDDVAIAAERVRAAGAAPWLAVAPGTDPAEILAKLPHVEGVLIMLIEPGTSAQADPRLRHKIEAVASRTAVGVDGGVNQSNLNAYLRAGAQYVVSGRGLLAAATTPDHIAPPKGT
jgi:pentose-5-phosphate-3-epimerase